MSAEIFSEDGGLIAGSQAWHGAFDVVPETFDREAALAHPNVGFQVERRPIFTTVTDGGTLARVPDRFAIVRMDTGQVLGDVGGQYAPHQTSSLFDFGDALKKVSGGAAKYECVFSLRHGRTVGALIHLADSGIEIGNDRAEAYAYCTTSFDGKTPTMAFLTFVQVVCGNTERMAIRGAKRDGGIIKVRHSGDTDSKMREAAVALETFGDQAADARELARELHASAPTADGVKAIIESMFPTPEDDASGSAKTRHAKRIELLGQGIAAEQKLLTAGDASSYMTLYHGFTRYADHLMPVQARGRNQGSAKLESAMTPNGGGSKIKDQALDVIVEAMRA